MKVKKLLKIILVSPSYLVVSYNGNNQTVYCDTSGYNIGDMYELEEDSLESKSYPIKKDNFKAVKDGRKKEEL